MIKDIFIILLVTIAFHVKAQQPSVEKSQTHYNLLIGVSHEQGVSRLNTIRLVASLDGGVMYQSTTVFGHTESTLNYYIAPTLGVDFRHYYNLSKRAEKNRKTSNNSGNFIAANTLLIGPSIIDDGFETDLGFALGASWGFQRTYGKRFNMQVHVGPGVKFSAGEVDFHPFLGLSLGFRLGE